MTLYKPSGGGWVVDADKRSQPADPADTPIGGWRSERLVIRDQASGTGNQGSAVRDQRSEILWIGGEGGVEQALVERAGIPFTAIPAGGLHGVGIVRLVHNTLKLAAGTLKAWQRLIGQHRPQAVLTTGGFVSVPVAVTCWLRRVPILLYLPDIEPGLAVKFVAKFGRG